MSRIPSLRRDSHIQPTCFWTRRYILSSTDHYFPTVAGRQRLYTGYAQSLHAIKLHLWSVYAVFVMCVMVMIMLVFLFISATNVQPHSVSLSSTVVWSSLPCKPSFPVSSSSSPYLSFPASSWSGKSPDRSRYSPRPSSVFDYLMSYRLALTTGPPRTFQSALCEWCSMVTNNQIPRY